MAPRHHLSDETLMAHVAGSLGESLSVVVASHLTLCPACRARCEEAEALGGVMIEEMEPVEMTTSIDDLFDRLEDVSFSEVPAADKTAKDVAADLSHIPKAVRDLLPQGATALPWKSLVPGIKHVHLKSDPQTGGTLRLLKLAPGTSIPVHKHSGSELTLVLEGSFTDECGRFARGDIADLSGDIGHQPIADTDKDCICLFATDGPLKFEGMLSRLFQPLIGI